MVSASLFGTKIVASYSQIQMFFVMKKILLAAAIACLPLFISCEKEGVPHTGDQTGALYAVWALDSKAEITTDANGEVIKKEVDYTPVHFYLTFGECPFPHAIAKKGSLLDFDLDDVDVDGVRFSYNSSKKQLTFKKTLWLTEGLIYSMRLKGTYDVPELTSDKLVLQKESLGVTTVYTYYLMK